MELLSKSTAPGWRNKCHLLLAFSSSRWNHSFLLIVSRHSFPSRNEKRYEFALPRPQMWYNAHRCNICINRRHWSADRELLMALSKDSRCTRWPSFALFRRRIDGRSENNSLADRTRWRLTFERDSARRRIMEFSLRRGDVWLMLRDFSFCCWPQITRCDDCTRGEIG